MGVVRMVAAIACFSPLLITIVFQIWPPTAMVHEVFGINFVGFMILEYGFHLVETGYCSIVVLNYIASIIVSSLFDHWSLFDRMSVFSIAFYAWHGALTFAVLAVATTDRSLRPMDCWGLLTIPLASSCLERVTCVGLMINYNKGAELAYLISAYLTIRWLAEARSFDRLTPVVMGALSGAFVGTKLAYAAIVAPLLCIIGISWDSREKREAAKNTLLFVSTATIVLAAIAIVFFRFHVDYIPQFVEATSKLYCGGWASQRTPFLFSELSNSHDPHSYYFSLRLFAGGVTVSFILTCWLGIKLRSWRIALLVGAQTLGFATLALLLWRRASQGTMIDVTNYLAFCGAVNSAAITRHCSRLRWCLPVFTLVTFVIGVAAADPFTMVGRLRHNSREARAIQNIISHRSSLPIVFYMAGLPQSLLFPSAEQIMLYELSSASDPSRCLREFCPRLQTAHPGNGLINEAHIAIIPEYIDSIPRTEGVLREWPSIWPAVQVLSEYPELVKGLQDRSEESIHSQFTEVQPRTHLLYYHCHPTQVHTYVVRPKSR